MTMGPQTMFWIATIGGLLALTFVLGDVMLPFVAGMAVAYFLDPVVDRIERWGISRTVATSVIIGLFFIVMLALLLLMAPVLRDQLVSFATKLPDYIKTLYGMIGPLIEHFRPLVERIEAELPADLAERLRGTASDYVAGAVQWVLARAKDLVTSGAAILNLLALLVITPVVAFYLLRDWDLLVAKVDSLLPRDQADTIREQLRLIDQSLAGFVRGQATVCMLLGLFYGIGLTLVGLEFGLVVGLATGLLSFIPYFGMLIGFVVGVGMALVQFSLDPLPIGLVIVVFAVGQAIEGNFLTPRLVGRRIGLHPVWVMFALLAGAALFGFVGVLLAVPVAAVIGVLVRFALSRYLESTLYLGAGERSTAETAAGPVVDAVESEDGP